MARVLVSLALGVTIGSSLLLGTAVVLYVTAPRAAPAVTPMLGTDHAGLAVSGAF